MTARRGPLVKLAVLATLIVGGVLLASFTPVGDYLSRDGIGRAITWLRGSTAAPLIYIALYAAATALAIPGSVLTLAGGAMFGVVWGTVYTTIAANLGANAAFGVARYLGRDGIEALAGDRLEKLDRATRDHGFRGLLTLRLIPAVPFNALNFGSGLTSIGWSTYAAATAIGIFPGTLVYTMFADALLAGSQEASRDAFLRVLLSGALLVLLSFLPTIAKRVGLRPPGAAAVIGFLTAATLCAAPVAVGAQAGELPDHGAFTVLLAEVVEMPGVDYAALQERRDALDAYIATLGTTSLATLEAASSDARLAFWINAYNACMLALVVEHYPIQKRGGLFSRITNAVAGRPDNSVWQIEDVFGRDHCTVAGRARSQDEIEHEIIRPMGEPRIHFVINCAARSCPPLWPEAYTTRDLDRQLDRAVDALLADEAHFRVEDGGEVVRVTKVLDWFIEDFGGPEGLRRFLADELPPPEAAVVTDPETSIEFFEYDWTLNDVAR